MAAELASASEHLEWLQALAVAMVSDRHTAEDLVQRAMQEASAKPSWEPGKLHAWLTGVVRNLARQHFRTESRRRARELRVVERAEARADGVHGAAETQTPEVLAQQVEAQQLLSAAVMDLPEKYRTVMLQFYYGEWSQKRIATAHGISVRAVETRLRRARERLRTRLEGEHGKDSWALALLPLLLRRPPPKAPPPLTQAGAGSLGAGWWTLCAAGVLLVGWMGLAQGSADPVHPVLAQGQSSLPKAPVEEIAANLEPQTGRVTNIPHAATEPTLVEGAGAGNLAVQCLEQGSGRSLADHPVRLHFLRQRAQGEVLTPEDARYFSPRDRVFVKLGEGFALSDADGLARLPVPAGTTLFYLTDGLHTATHSRVGYGQGGVALPRPASLEQPIPLEWARRTGTASGFVLDEQGRPLADAVVDVFHYAPQWPRPAPTMSLPTGPDGSFTIPDIACDQGGFELQARKQGYTAHRWLRTDRHAGFGEDYPGISLILRSDARPLKVLVSDEQGLAVGDAEVTVAWNGESDGALPGYAFGRYQGLGEQVLHTDAHGVAHFAEVPAKGTWVSIEKDGFRPLVRGLLVETREASFAMERGASFSLQVEAFDGASTEGAVVGLHGPVSSTYQRADTQGRVQFTGITVGTTLSLTVLHADYALLTWPEWKVGADRIEESVILQPGFAIDGQVVAAPPVPGKLAPRLFVRAVDPSTLLHLRNRGQTTPSLWQLAGIDVARTDADGRFRFENLPAGAVEVWWGQRRRPLAFARTEAGTADVLLQPGLGMEAFAQVDLRVTERSSGRPVSQYYLNWHRPDADLPLVKVRDAEGRHREVGLEPGFWSLTVWAPQGYTTVDLPRRQFPAGPTLLEVELLAARSLRLQVLDRTGEAVAAEVQVQDARGMPLLQGGGEGAPTRRWTPLDGRGRATLSHAPREEAYRVLVRSGQQTQTFELPPSSAEGEMRTLTWDSATAR